MAGWMQLFTKKRTDRFRLVGVGFTDNAQYCKNEVTNYKYTAITFIPMNFYEQFKRPLNRYFLLIGLLQLIPAIAPVNPLTTLGPLLLAFLITATKEGYDDLLRHRQDALFNKRPYTVHRNASPEPKIVESQDIMIGDVIKVHNGEEFPCDAFLIASSDEEGLAYIQTANIDGEIDLKCRTVHNEIMKLGSTHSLEAIAKFEGSLKYEAPNADVYKFDSTLQLQGQPFPVTSQNLLLQSCTLKNTEWVYGMVVYTGNETKVGMNKSSPPAKWAQVDQKISRLSLIVFCFQLCIAFGLGAAGLVTKFTKGVFTWYLAYPLEEHWGTFIIIPARFFLLTSVMIPISFKVIADISKYYISQAIGWDIKMYDEKTQKPAVANNTAIAEDLGQIEYILTDKTGTLTENVMEFKCCWVGNRAWGLQPKVSNSLNASMSIISDPDFLDQLNKKDAGLMSFFRLLAICNTVMPNQQPNGQYKYQGASPDEEALVSAAAACGMVLTHRTKNDVEIHNKLTDIVESYQILEVLEFTSDRKRMSVICKDKADGSIILLCKGADDKILERLSSTEKGPKIANMMDTLTLFASKGLRTLLTAKRSLTQCQFHTWHEKLSMAKVIDGSQEREAAVSAAAASVEVDLSLVGMSAIEDKLQEQVPETIQQLRKAGIAFWMLTGDKQETAEQIAIACNLVKPSEKLHHIEGRTDGEVERCLKSLNDVIDHGYASAHYGSAGTSPVTTTNRTSTRPTTSDDTLIAIPDATKELASVSNTDSIQDFSNLANTNLLGRHRQSHPVNKNCGVCLQIPGHVLQLALGPRCKDLFMKVAMRVPAVVCCRVTPSQKATVTRMVKARGHLTLSIGDGGNDVAMIQEAHVGVGISGKEGLQAARAADFSFSKFKFLQPLLLVHGHYSYMRTCFIVQYSFYKSILLSFCQIVFNFYAMFSGMTYWNSFMLATWNALFTTATVFAYVLDRDLPRPALLQNPHLYTHTRLGLSLNAKTFLAYCGRGLMQAAICMLVTFQVYNDSWAHSRDGKPIEQESIFTVTYTALICIQTITMIIESHTITRLNDIAIFGTFLFYVACLFIYSAMPKMAYYGVVMRHAVDPVFYLTVVLETGMCMSLDLAFQAWRYNNHPTILQRQHQKSHHKGEEKEYFLRCQRMPDEDELNVDKNL